MYNPYIPDTQGRPPGQAEHRDREMGGQGGGGLFGGLSALFDRKQEDAGIAGILKRLHLQEIDRGDLLLLLIILLLVLEGDETEMVVTLALLLLMGLGDGEEAS